MARLDVDIDGAKVSLMAARADETADGGLDIEIRPVERDPADVVARTIRALWKMALGFAWLARGQEALAPDWDHLRQAVLGAPFKGYLLQAPFVVTVTRRLHADVKLDDPHNAWAMGFALGGVALAVPLAAGARISRAEIRSKGWEVHTTEAPAPNAVHLRLDPTAPSRGD